MLKGIIVKLFDVIPEHVVQFSLIIIIIIIIHLCVYLFTLGFHLAQGYHSDTV